METPSTAKLLDDLGRPSKDALQNCIDFANREVLTQVAFPVTFIELTYQLYLASLAYEQALVDAVFHAENSKPPELREKPLTIKQYVSLLDPYLQKRYNDCKKGFRDALRNNRS